MRVILARYLKQLTLLSINTEKGLFLKTDGITILCYAMPYQALIPSSSQLYFAIQ